MNRPGLGLLATLVLTLSAARGAAAPGAAPVEVKPGDSFGIPLGGEVGIAGTKVVVGFVAVLEDSRCPKGEQCITAGSARVVLRVRAGADSPVDVELATMRGPSEAGAAGLRLRLVALEPHPVAGKSIDPRSYLVKVSVTEP